jgi:acetylornithine deacetylase
MTEPDEILRELVSIPSISALSNRPVIELAARLLEAAGWSIRFFPYLDPRGVEKINAIARPAHQARPLHQDEQAVIDLAFICHTDTVPFSSDEWPGATEPEIKAGYLYGCGACDVKGSLAAMLAAIARVPAAAIRKRAALILTADEEAGCVGAQNLLAAQKLAIGHAIVCEPTSLRPGIAGKGYGLAEVTVTGREAHSALPAMGSSAILAAAKMILKIEDGAHRPHAPHAPNALFDPPHTTFNVGTIEGGTAKNIVPGRCSFLVEWRPLPEEDPQAALLFLQQCAQQVQAEFPGVSIAVDGRRAEAGFAPQTSPGSPGSQLAAMLTDHLRRQPTGISFGSEATRFATVAREVVVVGPGDMLTAHSDRERISIAEMEEFTACVAALLTMADV